MVWSCDACDFSQNDDGSSACVACSSARTTSSSIDSSNVDSTRDSVQVVVIDLAQNEKLGVICELMMPFSALLPAMPER